MHIATESILRLTHEFISLTNDMNSYDRDDINSYVSVGV